jgi:hypothetical protein
MWIMMNKGSDEAIVDIVDLVDLFKYKIKALELIKEKDYKSYIIKCQEAIITLEEHLITIQQKINP